MSNRAKFRAELAHDSVFLARGAVVVGEVTLGENVSVWFNAVIRGDNAPIKIGARSNIQDGCVIHVDEGVPCTLGEGVTVGHGAVIHGATIGDNALVGMKAVVQNGAVIGENSIVAVGAVVTEGTQVPPGSLVMGLPAKVKRTVTPQEIQINQLAAAHYVENAQIFKSAE